MSGQKEIVQSTKNGTKVQKFNFQKDMLLQAQKKHGMSKQSSARHRNVDQLEAISQTQMEVPDQDLDHHLNEMEHQNELNRIRLRNELKMMQSQEMANMGMDVDAEEVPL